ncbi:MAG: hypothetical protein Fur0018_14460 [Anaerolineales bacterium]
MKVLLLALHSLLAEGIETILRRETDIEVQLAASAEDAIACWQTWHPHLILIAGPIQSAAQASSFVRILQTCHNLPILQIGLESERLYRISVQEIAGAGASLPGLLRQTTLRHDAATP